MSERNWWDALWHERLELEEFPILARTLSQFEATLYCPGYPDRTRDVVVHVICLTTNRFIVAYQTKGASELVVWDHYPLTSLIRVSQVADNVSLYFLDGESLTIRAGSDGAEFLKELVLVIFTGRSGSPR